MRLKRKLQSKLQHTPRRGHEKASERRIANRSVDARMVQPVLRRKRKVNVVEYVERFRTELNRGAFRHPEFTQQRSICIERAWTAQDILSGSAKRPDSVHGK